MSCSFYRRTLIAVGLVVVFASDHATAQVTPAPNSNPTTARRKASSDRPQPNVGLGRAKAASRSISRRLADELEDRLLDYVDEFQDALKRVTFSDLDRDDVIDALNEEDANQKYVEQLDDALVDLDPVAVQRACRKLQMPAAKTEALVNRIDVSSSFSKLKQKIEDGDSAMAINRVARKLRRDLKAVNLQGGRRLALLDLLELIVAGARVRDAVEGGTFRSLPSSAKVDWPVGQVPTVFYPRIPKGQVFVLAGVCLVAGADTNSDIVFGMRSVAEAMNLPVFADVPAVPNRAPSSQATEGAVLRNPEGSGAALHYVTGTDFHSKYNRKMKKDELRVKDGTEGELEPGETSDHLRRHSYVEFQRGKDSKGKDRGIKFYELHSGLFVFRHTEDEGWDLKGMNYEVTLDNSSNPKDFHYVVNGKSDLVAAGREKKHATSFPIVIKFNKGAAKDGTLTKIQDSTGSGTVWKVGVNIDTNYWDVFSIDDIPLVNE